jgi:hypothetical protein
MAEYLMRDRDKAAFTNKMNDFLGQVKPGTKLNTQNFIDIPGDGADDKCIFITDNPIEIQLLDKLIDKKTFSYPIKKINLKQMVEASRS